MHGEIDVRWLRGQLARERITHTRFAESCGLSRAFLCHVLAGHRQPGQLATLKIRLGIERLGLDREEDCEARHDD
jgi:hypothetical protein